MFMVELSLDSVMGEWIKNGEKIKPSSTIKIRQEGRYTYFIFPPPFFSNVNVKHMFQMM